VTGLVRAGFVYPVVGDAWLGGVNYLRNLLLAITATPECGVTPVLFAGRRAQVNAGFPPTETVRTGLADAFATPWLARGVLRKALDWDVLLERALRARGVRVLSHSGHLGRRAHVPAIAWVEDFQHRHLPEFFSAREKASRDANFEASCRNATRVLVSSEAALCDVERFHPEWVSKARVLHFVDCSTSAEKRVEPTDLQARHGVSGPFVLLPNQFWAHKNHRIVLEALAILRARGQPIRVVATGHTSDYRNPAFFETLMRRRAELGVEEDFRVLGLVPYADLATLMRQAVALVNPSLFEGWSTTVEEAKSLGKVVVLSDIPVHREQAPERGIYFDPRDGGALADALWQAWIGHDPGADRSAAERAAASLPERRRAFAERYARIVREVT
jgi:glycosyltransferase involved in cell wall biosynthesis